MNNNLESVNDLERFWQDVMVVIVLYNSSLQDSKTFQTLKSSITDCDLHIKLNILICDNSIVSNVDVDSDNKDGSFNLYYFHDPKNPGVSQSYNRAAELAQIKDKKFLFVLDQDTVLPFDLLTKYHQGVNSLPGYPIYAPMVYSDKILFSPCRYIFMKGSNLRSIEPGVHSMANRNVLNSGLLINLEDFWAVGGYDETVPLYFSDFVFFNRLKKYFKNFAVLDCRLDHQLSSVDYSNIALALTRFSYYCTGARQASSGNKYDYFKYFITVGLRSVMMSYRFHSFRFLTVFAKDFIMC